MSQIYPDPPTPGEEARNQPEVRGIPFSIPPSDSSWSRRELDKLIRQVERAREAPPESNDIPELVPPTEDPRVLVAQSPVSSRGMSMCIDSPRKPDFILPWYKF